MTRSLNTPELSQARLVYQQTRNAAWKVYRRLAAGCRSRDAERKAAQEFRQAEQQAWAIYQQVIDRGMGER